MCVIHFLRLIRLGAPKDLSEKSGSVLAGVIYSNTGAMLPMQKESAYKHLPTYTVGIILHIGIFTALLCFLLLFFDTVWEFFFQYTLLSLLVALCFFFCSCCGIVLIIKRLTSKKLCPISNLDDYLSIILVTLFQFISALLFTTFAFHEVFHKYFSSEVPEWIIIPYFIFPALLFIYLPFGKLRHAVYYFAARYHLGFFYFRRGTLPLLKKQKVKN
jgi:nitrate reductase gamma subunit